MLVVRPFRNTDPAILVDIWNRVFSTGDSALVQISLDLLYEHVLGLPFFDSTGLLIAFDDDRPVGFAHAAFGPNGSGSNIDMGTGVIPLVLVVPSYPNAAELTRLFVTQCEDYLVARGANVIFGSSTRPSASFYSGLYGGSEPLGVCNSNENLIHAYEGLGFNSIFGTARFRQDLRKYRPPFTPKSVAWRRKLKVKYSDKYPMQAWFRACVSSHFNWFGAEAISDSQAEPVAKLSIRISHPMEKANLGVMTPTAAALVCVDVDQAYRQKGVATFLIGESIRHLVSEHHTNVIETMSTNTSGPFAALLRRLGWEEFDRGQIFIKIINERRKETREDEETKAFAVK